MQWSDIGLILGSRQFGENSLVLDVLTKEHGRHSGMVRGGTSRRLRPLIQKGNTITLTWRARLDEHLGNYAIDAHTLRSATLIENRYAVYAIGLLCQMLTLLPERDPHKDIFHLADRLADTLTYQVENALSSDWLKAYALFELKFLEILGFPLDILKCGATGRSDNLTYVSPKTGRAICLEAGRPYHSKLLPLSSIFIFNQPAEEETINCVLRTGLSQDDNINNPETIEQAIIKALELTGYFLTRNVFEPRAKKMPFERDKILDYLTKSC